MKRTRRPKAPSAALLELQTIPGIGPSIAQDLVDLGITKVSELNGRDPEVLYRRFEKLVGARVDRCLLYTFRCAVYYASNTRHKPRLLKWWNWMDASVPKR